MPAPRPGAEAAEPTTLDALRAQGAHRFDPVRFRFAEALARRAAAQGPAVQAALQPRLQQALSDLARRHAAAGLVGTSTTDTNDTTNATGLAGPVGPLGELVQWLNQQHSGANSATSASGATEPPPPPGAPAELKALRQFRSTWASLGVDQQLNRSLAQAPENPGPLNSHRLVLRALQKLQALSPAYLQRFLAQGDALLWLEQLSAAQAPAAGQAPRRERKPPKPKAAAPARTRAR